MSAPPTGPPGSTPNGVSAGTAPNGAPRPAVRRRPPPSTNPLVAAQKRGVVRRPPPARTNGNAPGGPGPAGAPAAAPRPAAQARPTYGPPPGARVEEFPIVATKKSLLQGLRHHVMRFQTRHPVNPTDQSDFTRPIRLHRRDPGLGKSGAGAQEEEEDEEDEKEREKQEALREERRRNREEIQSQIAPKGKSRNNNSNAKKTQQVYDRQDTEQSRKAAQLRYEETLPWHLEDFDNKNTWVGSYEAALSETHAMLIFEKVPLQPGNLGYGSRLRMIPLEKWYKFTAKDKSRAVKAEDSGTEKQTKVKKEKLPDWIVSREKAKQEKMDLEMAVRRAKGHRARVGADAEEDRPRARPDGTKPEVDADMDQIDFDVEEAFADDEEGAMGLFEGDDEDTKAVQNKLRKEQMGAKHITMQNETEAWEEEEEEARKAEEAKRLEREVRKALTKREKNYNYLDDDDDDSSSDDTEAERQKEEERKREEEARAAEREKLEQAKKTTDKTPASGASSKGSNTPSGRPKTMDPLKTSASSLKRPGSPNLSEQSGSESTRKKHKKDKPSDAARPQDPALRRLGAGSGSDSEAADAAKKQRPLPIGSPRNGTPGGSRAGSPVIQPSRAGSPASFNRPQQQPAPAAQATGAIPTIEEIKAAIPPQGINMGALTARFKARIGGNAERTRVFIANVKAAGRFDKETKKLFQVGK